MQDWKIDKHIPVAVIFAIMLQSFAIIWWAAQLEKRVQILELRMQHNIRLMERVSRVEEKVSILKEVSRRIEDKLDELRKVKTP
jgi:hypothetical protein